MEHFDSFSLGAQFVRVTEAAAIAASEWVGRGDKHAADGAAVDAMRKAFDRVNIRGTVVIGEGEMDEAPMLYIGEKVGSGKGPDVDIAVDPLEGTNLTANNHPNSMAVFAVAPANTLLHAPDMYMEKIAVGPDAAGVVDLERSPTENARLVAHALGKDVRELNVVVLDRPRHRELIASMREAGVRLRLLSDGDVTPVLLAGLMDRGVDLVIGTGGAPEGVLAAVAIRCLGGDFQGRLAPGDEEEAERARQMLGSKANELLLLDDLVHSDDVYFAASAITDGDLLPGVVKSGTTYSVHSILLMSKPRSRHILHSVYPRSE